MKPWTVNSDKSQPVRDNATGKGSKGQRAMKDLLFALGLVPLSGEDGN